MMMIISGIGVSVDIELLQKAMSLGTARVLRKVLVGLGCRSQPALK